MKHTLLYRSILIGFALLACLSVIPARAQTDAPLVIVLTADGAVSPAMAEYVQRGIQVAEQRGADLIVLQLNTPGGAIDVMEEMKQNMLASSVPIVVYIQPAGAWAASAGTIITLAGHAAAMAPNTTIGAASPVSGEGEDLDSTSEAKVKSVMRATARSLAERRGPEAVALAEDTIENAAAVYADEALAVGLVDFIARDLDDLLQQLDGFTVTVDGKDVILHTAGAVTEPVNMSFIEQLLLVLTNPNVVFLLLSVGVQAILIEISSPGGWVAGFIGVVCIALATYGMGILPVNWFGIVFIATAFVLFIIDIKAPTHGGLTVAGIGSMIVGALVLFNSPSTPSFQRVSVPLVIVTSLFTGALFFSILMVALRAQRAPIRTGQESIVGRVGMVRSELNPSGSVHMAGELWSADLAEGEPPLPVGTQVRVIRVDGLRIVVERVGKERSLGDSE